MPHQIEHIFERYFEHSKILKSANDTSSKLLILESLFIQELATEPNIDSKSVPLKYLMFRPWLPLGCCFVTVVTYAHCLNFWVKLLGLSRLFSKKTGSY